MSFWLQLPPPSVMSVVTGFIYERTGHPKHRALLILETKQDQSSGLYSCLVSYATTQPSVERMVGPLLKIHNCSITSALHLRPCWFVLNEEFLQWVEWDLPKTLPKFGFMPWKGFTSPLLGNIEKQGISRQYVKSVMKRKSFSKYPL